VLADGWPGRVGWRLKQERELEARCLRQLELEGGDLYRMVFQMNAVDWEREMKGQVLREIHREELRAERLRRRAARKAKREELRQQREELRQQALWREFERQ
jgi:hypothetical protein